MNDKDTAIQHIEHTEKINRLRATLDLLVQIQTNAHWRENRLKFVQLRDAKEGLKKHANEESEDAMCIRFQLNQYEIIAAGIDVGILDEDLYRRYYQGTYLRDFNAAK